MQRWHQLFLALPLNRADGDKALMEATLQLPSNIKQVSAIRLVKHIAVGFGNVAHVALNIKEIASLETFSNIPRYNNAFHVLQHRPNSTSANAIGSDVFADRDGVHTTHLNPPRNLATFTVQLSDMSGNLVNSDQATAMLWFEIYAVST